MPCYLATVKENDMRALCLILTATVVPVLAACPGAKDVQCRDNTSCDLASGGACLAADTGNMWCAYPDPGCPSGFRYSDQDVGDGLGSVCTALEVYTLSVSVGGSAAGSVDSNPVGLTCESGTCTQTFPIGAQIELSAMTPTGAFLGWADACSGFSTCVVTMDSDKKVGALFGMPGQALWVQHGGTIGDDVGRSIARDTDANLVVVGEFRNTMSFGGKSLSSAGGSDVFVAKLDGLTGDVLWAKRFGGTSDDAPSAVAVDDMRNIYVAGSFSGTVDFGGGAIQSAGGPDGFILKLDAAGAHGWSHGMGGSQYDVARALAVRGNAVVVVGEFQGSMTANGMTLTSAGNNDAWLARFTIGGAYQWVKSVGGTGTDVPNGVALDTTDNIVVAGTFGGMTNLGGLTLASAGFNDVFIAKYTGATGAHLFSKRLGANGFDLGLGVAVDGNDSVFLLGQFYGSVDFGGPAPLTAATNKMFLVKYTLAGAYAWSQAFGEPAVVTGSSVITNTAGDVAIAGIFCGSVSFGGAVLSSVRTCAENDRDMFAARFAGSTGAHINSARAGGTALDDARSITQMTDGRIFLTGGFQGFAEFGGEGLTSNGGYDVVVLGLAPL